jgi:hypothetical protein
MSVRARCTAHSSGTLQAIVYNCVHLCKLLLVPQAVQHFVLQSLAECVLVVFLL